MHTRRTIISVLTTVSPNGQSFKEHCRGGHILPIAKAMQNFFLVSLPNVLKPECADNTKPTHCVSHVPLRPIDARSHATITNTGFGVTKTKSLDTTPVSLCRHQLACASRPSFFTNSSIFCNNCYVGLSTTSLPN